MSAGRKALYQSLAEELGWKALNADDKRHLLSLQHFLLMHKARHGKIRQGIVNPSMNCTQFVFDLEYLVGKATEAQTVYYVSDVRLNLPHFRMYPEHLYHKLAGLFGLRDIDFTPFKDFSSNYILSGESEPEIRKIITDSVLGFFSYEKNWTLEAQGGELMMFQEDKLMPPDKIRAFLQVGQTIKELFSGKEW